MSKDKHGRETMTIRAGDVATVDLTKTGTTAVAAIDYGEDAAKGFEGTTDKDMQLPFLVVVQPLTPGVVEGTLKPGDFLNTVTGETTDGKKGVLVVVGTTRNAYAEFTPRIKGGGYHGQHEIDSPVVAKARATSKEFGEYITDSGTELVETFYQFAVLCSEQGEPLTPIVLPYKSTHIKAYKNWITQARAHQVALPNGRKITPPLYAHLVRITTELREKNTNKWFVPVLRPANGTIPASLLEPTDPRFIAARSTGELVASGAAKVDYSKQGGKDDAGAAGDAKPF